MTKMTSWAEFAMLVLQKYGQNINLTSQQGWSGMISSRPTAICTKHNEPFVFRPQDLLKRNSGCKFCKVEISRDNLKKAHLKGATSKGVLKYDAPGFIAA